MCFCRSPPASGWGDSAAAPMACLHPRSAPECPSQSLSSAWMTICRFQASGAPQLSCPAGPAGHQPPRDQGLCVLFVHYSQGHLPGRPRVTEGAGPRHYGIPQPDTSKCYPVHPQYLQYVVWQEGRKKTTLENHILSILQGRKLRLGEESHHSQEAWGPASPQCGWGWGVGGGAGEGSCSGYPGPGGCGLRSPRVWGGQVAGVLVQQKP